MQRNLSVILFYTLVIFLVAHVAHAAVIPLPIIKREDAPHTPLERDSLLLRAGPNPHETFPTIEPAAPKPPAPFTTVGAAAPIPVTTVGAAIETTTVDVTVPATTIDAVVPPVPFITSDALAPAPTPTCSSTKC